MEKESMYQSNIREFILKNLDLEQQVNHMAIKLNKAKSMLSKSRAVLDKQL